MGEGSGTSRGRSRSRRRRRSRNRSRRRGNSTPQQDARGNKASAPKGNRARKKRRSSARNNGVRAADNNTPCLGAQRYFSGELNAFELFCAYHLGLSSDGSVKNHSLNDLARRFGTDRAGIDAALVEFRMDRDHVRKSSFDLEMAKLDVTVVPPGVDRVEVARTIYGDFLAAGCGVGPVPAGRAGGPTGPEVD